MKQLFATTFFALLLCCAASAQRLQVGIRGGVNLPDHSFRSISIGDRSITSGAAKVGYEVGFVLRLNLSRHLHLQSELNYAFVNYSFDVAGTYRRNVLMRTERFEIPVELGFQFGPVRIFGGANLRVANAERSSVPNLLRVRFNNDNIGIVGGLGFNIRKFFIDLRVSGYPASHVWNTFICDGLSQRVKISREMVYGGSLGFFF